MRLSPTSRENFSDGARFGFLLPLFFILFAAVALLRCSTLDEDYNEAITRLELSGQESFPWPHHPFVGVEYLRPLGLLGDFQEVAQIVLFSDTHPPLYPLGLWAWAHLVGNSLTSLRILSALCLLLSGYFFFLATDRLALSYRLSALLLFLLSLTAGGEIFRARNYALALLFTQLSLWAASRRGNLTLLGIFAGLAFSTHYLSLLFSFPIILFVLWTERTRITRRTLLHFSLFILLAAFPGLIALSLQLGARDNQFAGFPGLEKEFFAGILSLGEFLLGRGVLPSAALCGVLCFGAFLFFSILRKRRGEQKSESDAEALWWIDLSILTVVCYSAGLLLLDLTFDKTILSKGPSRYWTFLGGLPWMLPLLGFPRHRKLELGILLLLLLLVLPLKDLRSILENISGEARQTPQDRLASRCQEKDLIVLGSGYGRGHPGKWISLLMRAGCRTPFFVLTPENENQLGLYLREKERTVFIPSGEAINREGEERIASSSRMQTLEESYREDLATKAKDPRALASPSPNGS